MDRWQVHRVAVLLWETEYDQVLTRDDTMALSYVASPLTMALQPKESLFERDGFRVIYWDIPDELLLVGAALLYGDQAPKIQFTSLRSPPREVRDFQEELDARPVWIFPDRVAENAEGIKVPVRDKVHALWLGPRGHRWHDAGFHYWRSALQGPIKRQETVGLFDCLVAAHGADITFESPPSILDATDAIQTGVDMYHESEWTRYSTYLNMIFRLLKDGPLASRLQQNIAARFSSHRFLPKMSQVAYRQVYGKPKSEKPK